jgi:hypothetical protein
MCAWVWVGGHKTNVCGVHTDTVHSLGPVPAISRVKTTLKLIAASLPHCLQAGAPQQWVAPPGVNFIQILVVAGEQREASTRFTAGARCWVQCLSLTRAVQRDQLWMMSRAWWSPAYALAACGFQQRVVICLEACWPSDAF